MMQELKPTTDVTPRQGEGTLKNTDEARGGLCQRLGLKLIMARYPIMCDN
jgi:hypothetical protein